MLLLSHPKAFGFTHKNKDKIINAYVPSVTKLIYCSDKLQAPNSPDCSSKTSMTNKVSEEAQIQSDKIPRHKKENCRQLVADLLKLFQKNGCQHVKNSFRALKPEILS